MSKYQKLDVWKTTMELVKETYLLTKKYPKDELFALTSQTRRSAVSVPANFTEGMGRQYKKDTIQFLHVSRGSLYELETNLNFAMMIQIKSEEDLMKISGLIEKSMQLLNGFINYMEKADLK